jgi:hypothetical protein
MSSVSLPRFASISCVLAFSFLSSAAFGQGCVIARGGGACGTVMDGNGYLQP